MTTYTQADLFGGKMYHAHGRKHQNAVAGKPDAVKAACPVWWGAHGTGPSPRWYLAGCLPNGDISKCFDRLNHSLILTKLREYIKDERFIRLIAGLLKAGYLEEWRWNATYSGAPQGSIISPMLSNLSLDALDTFVETILIPEYTRGIRRKFNPAYEKLMHRANYLARKGRKAQARALRTQAQRLPSIVTNDPDYRRLRYCRYADDFLLGFIGPKAEAEAIKERLRDFLRETLKLELSETKTLITHARTETARFLNYEIHTLHEDTKWDRRKRRSVNGNIGLRIPKEVTRVEMSSVSPTQPQSPPSHRTHQ